MTERGRGKRRGGSRTVGKQKRLRQSTGDNNTGLDIQPADSTPVPTSNAPSTSRSESANDTESLNLQPWAAAGDGAEQHEHGRPQPLLNTVSVLEYEKVCDERDKALETCNNYKKEVQTLKVDLAKESVNNRLLREKLEVVQNKLNQEVLEKTNIQLLNNQLSKTSTTQAPKQSQRFLAKLTKSIDNKFLSLATAVERRLSEWAHSETMEVNQTVEFVKKRNWNGRMIIVQEFGIEHSNVSDGSHYNMVPTLISSVVHSTDVFFIRSFDSYESVLRGITGTLLEETTWSAFRPSASIREETLSVISSDPVMIGKVKQSLSDCISNRKRSVRDELFNILRYFSLKSSHDRRKHTPIFTKEEEIKLAKEKLLGECSTDTGTRVDNHILEYSAWRSAPIEQLSCDGTVPENLQDLDCRVDKPVLYDDDSSDSDDDGSGDIPRDSETNRSSADSVFKTSCLGLFTNEFSTQLFNMFIGFDPYEDPDNVCETSIVSLTRLDAWVATVVQLLVCTEKRGGGRQRDYSHFFHRNHMGAVSQFTQIAYRFVHYWAREELEVPETGGSSSRERIINHPRTATIILHESLSNRYYIAIRSDWFSKYISSCMGIVHDCYIARISDNWTSIDPITFESERHNSSSVPIPSSTQTNNSHRETVPNSIPDVDTGRPPPVVVPPLPALPNQ